MLAVPLVGLNTREINHQFDALFIEDNYQLQNKGWGGVKFTYTEDDQIVDKQQRDTPAVPAGTCLLLGDP
jgi:hypothetical protein